MPHKGPAQKSEGGSNGDECRRWILPTRESCSETRGWIFDWRRAQEMITSCTRVLHRTRLETSSNDKMQIVEQTVTLFYAGKSRLIWIQLYKNQTLLQIWLKPSWVCKLVYVDQGGQEIFAAWASIGTRVEVDQCGPVEMGACLHLMSRMISAFGQCQPEWLFLIASRVDDIFIRVQVSIDVFCPEG